MSERLVYTKRMLKIPMPMCATETTETTEKYLRTPKILGELGGLCGKLYVRKC